MQETGSIISYILKEKILDEQSLEKLVERQKESGRSFVSFLKENELINEDQFARILAFSSKTKFVNLSPDMVDSMAAHMVTHEMAIQHNLIPIKKEGDNLEVAMSTPLNIAVRDQIEIRMGCKVVPVAATPSAIRQAIRYHFDVRNVTRQAIASMRLKGDESKETQKDIYFSAKSQRVENDPITKLVSSIITGAIDACASDVHIEPQQPDMRIRYRIDGLLHDEINIPSSAELEVVSHIKILADMDISEKRMPQDGHIQLQHNGRDYDLRVSSLPSVSGEKIVIRILDKSAKKWSLDSIVSDADDNKRFRELTKNPYGMILLTGPTGSGKTTTLYSILQLLNTPERNIVTVEDPVEYHLEGITQVQVKPIAGMTFSSALRSILRQDPDIILVGEIRDLETAEIAISAALTGHLVLSTLHTNDAAGAISRLVNIGVPSYLVASALLGSVAQRLVRMNCPKCQKAYAPPPEELEQLFESSQTSKDMQLFKSIGCNDCYQTGYRGRTAIYEILPVSPEIRRMIVDSRSDSVIKRTAIKEGMKTLRKSGLEYLSKGVTTVEELLRVVDMEAD